MCRVEDPQGNELARMMDWLLPEKALVIRFEQLGRATWPQTSCACGLCLHGHPCIIEREDGWQYGFKNGSTSWTN